MIRVQKQASSIFAGSLKSPCWLQHAGKAGYLSIGLGASLPCVFLPWLLEHKADRSKPWSQKYWVKANIWIAIFSFIGNYFWTHYFYTVLGAEYTFPSWRLNEVHCSVLMLYLTSHPNQSSPTALSEGVCCDFAGPHHTVFNDPCLLLFLSCAFECRAEEDSICCAAIPPHLSMVDFSHCCVCSGISHCSDGDGHHCTLPLLQIQGTKCCNPSIIHCMLQFVQRLLLGLWVQNSEAQSAWH